jgi:hypothetical protein
MPTLKILSGGAAQGLVNALAPQFETQTGFRIEGEFGAVGAMAAKLRSGVSADLLILTSALIAELTREGYVAPSVQVTPIRGSGMQQRCAARFSPPTRSTSPTRSKRRPASTSLGC